MLHRERPVLLYNKGSSSIDVGGVEWRASQGCRILHEAEELGAELEEQCLVLALGKEVRTSAHWSFELIQSPKGKGQQSQESFASIHEKFLIMASASGATGVAYPWDSSGTISEDRRR